MEEVQQLQHLTTELVYKCYFNRKSLPAEALTVNTSILI